MTLYQRIVKLLILSVPILTLPMTAQQKPSDPPKDLLIFTNGDQLSGVLVRGIGDTVVFKSDMAGEITVKLSTVRELRTNGDFAVLRHHVPVQESRKIVPAKIDVKNDSVVVAAANATQPIPIKDVAYIIDSNTYKRELAQDVRFFEGWNGSVNLGATLVQSTQHGGTFSGGVALFRQVPVLLFFRPRNKTLVNVQETYGTMTTPLIPQTNPPTPDAVVKTSILHADAERDEYFSKKAYGLGSIAFDHNYAQGLDLQQVYGVGIGYTPFSTPVHQLDLKADVHYEKQQFTNGTVDNLIGSTFAEAYRRALPRSLVLTESAAILPAWNNLNAYSANGSVTLEVPVFRRLSVNFVATDSFLNNPSFGYQKNSFQFVTGLSYTLR